MKTTSETLKAIKANINYMIDNQYRATLSIMEEQNQMFNNKRSANDENEVSEFFDFQIESTSGAMNYLFELRESLTEATDAPSELQYILNRLEEEAAKGCNEWIFDTFSDVIEYMEHLKSFAVSDHSNHVENDGENVLKAA